MDEAEGAHQPAVSSMRDFGPRGNPFSLDTTGTDNRSTIERRWRYPWKRFSSLLEQHEDQVFLFLALLIGALVGLVVVAFILVTERLGMRLYPPGGAAWRRLLVPTAGSLAMGYLLYRYFPDARGSGVPQTKAALFARDGRITLGTVFGKFFCTSATLASGIPLGREGPAVQVGAGISSVLGRTLGLSTEKVKALLPVGAAAAIAAAFNTPMAAVVFALEEILGDLHAPVLGSVVLASATSWAVLRVLLGNNPLFHVPQYELVHPAELGIYAVLGIAGGLLSAAFTRSLLAMRAWFLRLPRNTRWWHPVIGGVTAGVMGWFVPQVLGVGYGFVGDALNGGMALRLMALLVVLKLIAVVTSYASGNAGGIFGPSLFLGAMLGGTIGGVAHHLFPAYTATPGAYALVGMGALFAGIVRAPMTSVLMIFEITRDYSVIVPLMIANLVSLFIASRLQKTPTYEALALQQGIHLPSSATRAELGRRKVAQVMRQTTEMLPCQTLVRDTLEIVRTSPSHSWLVEDQGSVVGVVSRNMLERALKSNGADPEKRLRDLLDPLDFPHVHPDHALHLALERMSASQLDLLPVVNRANVHKLEGVIALRDILESYGVDTSGSS
jgi:CIC family chloride channel protein